MCITCCANLFDGLFLSIPQVTEKERELDFMGTPREMWDF
jgi:hypothetical protein